MAAKGSEKVEVPRDYLWKWTILCFVCVICMNLEGGALTLLQSVDMHAGWYTSTEAEA